jgi:hypothetical protein
MLESGVAENALPRSAKATVNCRILPGISPQEVMATLVEIIADDTIKIRALEGGSAPSPPSPLRQDVLSVIREIGSEYWGPIPFVPYQSPGATDGLWIRKAGIPVYGFSGLSVEINDVRAHGLDERLKIDSFHTGVRYWYRLLKALSGSPDSTSRVRRQDAAFQQSGNAGRPRASSLKPASVSNQRAGRGRLPGAVSPSEPGDFPDFSALDRTISYSSLIPSNRPLSLPCLSSHPSAASSLGTDCMFRLA